MCFNSLPIERKCGFGAGNTTWGSGLLSPKQNVLPQGWKWPNLRLLHQK